MLSVVLSILLGFFIISCNATSEDAPPMDEEVAPSATETSLPTATATELPTETSTLVPTETPLPTETPQPTFTPTPTVVALSSENAVEILPLVSWETAGQGIQLLSDGRLLSGGDTFYDVETGEEIGKLDLDFPICNWNVASSPTEPLLWAGLIGADNQCSAGAALISLETGEIIAQQPLPVGGAQANGTLTFSPDGKTALVGWFVYGENFTTTMTRWDFENEPVVLGRFPRSIKFSPEGSLIAAVGGGTESNTIGIFDAATNEEVTVLMAAKFDQRGNYNSLFWLPDSQHILVDSPAYPGNVTQPVQVWNTESGEVVMEFGSKGTQLLAVSPNGTLAVTLDLFDADLKVYDITTGELVATLKGHNTVNDYNIGSGLFSPDGSLLITTTADKLVIVWGLEP